MGLPDLVRNMIAGPALSIAGPFRADIQVERMTGRGTYGPTYATPTDESAIVEQSSELVTSADGTEKVSTAKFTFLEPVSIKEGDRITLNGVKTNVVKIGGVLDENGVPYVPEAWTGK